MKQNKIDDALFDCYRELFANSTPKGDFDKLVEEATVNERGQKVIPFDNYELSEEKFQEIIVATLKKHKVPKSLHESFSVAIHLGCSPRFSKK
jgi:hypothetical protein